MIYSASSYTAYLDYNGDSAHYLKRQLLAVILGLIAMTIVANIPYHFWEKFAILGYVVSLAIIPIVKTPLGIESHGARRWFRIPGIPLQVQPAEVAKLCMILFLACLVCKLGRNAGRIKPTKTNFDRFIPGFLSFSPHTNCVGCNSYYSSIAETKTDGNCRIYHRHLLFIQMAHMLP